MPDGVAVIPESEQGFLGAIIELAQLCGWRAHHGRPALSNKGWRTPIQGDAGFLDLVLVRRPRVIIAEIKSDRGRLTPDQQAWLKELEGCLGVESYVWRPRMFEDIVGILR